MTPAWSRLLQRAWLGRGLLATALWPLSLLFGTGVRIRRMLYTSGRLPVQTLPVPVIVVGNLIVGGAGKTPAVISIVKLLQRQGYTPGVVSRGYGRKETATLIVETGTRPTIAGDEPLLILRRTGAAVAVGRDRASTAEFLLEMQPEVDIIVSDDGLQHLGLASTAQVMLFDERGIGNGWLLPAGPLREPLPARAPAGCLVLYNARTRTTKLRGELATPELLGVTPLADWYRGGEPSLAALDELKTAAQQPILAAAGMAHPQRFFAMLRRIGLSIAECALPDHYAYSTLPWPDDTSDVIVTEKDAVKLAPASVGKTRVWVATLDFGLPDKFEIALLTMLPKRPTR